MSQYFLKPYERFGGDINVKVDLSNYATKSDLKNMSHVDVRSFALKSNLASLKAEADKLDIAKLVPVPNDLAKLSHIVKNDVVNKTKYDKLLTKVNGIDTTNFVSRTKYEKDGSGFEDKISKIDKKIPHVSDLVKKAYFDSTITELKNKIPSIIGLATTSALTAVENKIPDVNNLIKKIDFDDKFKKLVT